MSADEVTHLLANNTMHCSNLQKGEAFTNYFRDDGTVTKLAADGTQNPRARGVSPTMDSTVSTGASMSVAIRLIDQGNGTYQKIEDDKPRTEFTVSEGNPNGL